MNSKRVDLLDHPRLLNQFAGLERRTARGGRDSIDHAPGSHDDLCNVAAGVLLATQAPERTMWVGCYGDGGPITWLHKAERRTRIYRDHEGQIRLGST